MDTMRSTVSRSLSSESGRDAESRISAIADTNYLFTTRKYMRIYFAEFLGTMILVLWVSRDVTPSVSTELTLAAPQGEGTQAQVLAARKEPGDYLSIAWGWGIGFMLAIYVSSGISGEFEFGGGHRRRAVTELA